MNNRLTIYILIVMAAGIALGYWVYVAASPAFAQSFADNIKLLTKIFLNLVQMIIAPLVFSTLVVGIAKLGDLKTVGRVGGKALLWFVSASLTSLLKYRQIDDIFMYICITGERMKVRCAVPKPGC